jgi:flagellar protein FliL
MPVKSPTAPPIPTGSATTPPVDAAAVAESAKKGAPSLLATLGPLVGVLVAAPLLTWAVAQFVLMPRLEKRLAAAAAPEAAAKTPAPAEETAEPKKGEPGAASNTYEFSNIIVNLAGSMGTRYLKTSFLVTGTDATLRATFEGSKAKLVDVTLNVLSSLSISDLEEAGAKNLIRQKLVVAYNQALGKRVAEQVYFSDFVVQ